MENSRFPVHKHMGGGSKENFKGVRVGPKNLKNTIFGFNIFSGG